jgi:hypothetical protein
VVGPANRLISGDYPAFARKALEAVAPGSIALFLPGAAGDVNTGHSAEASYSLSQATPRTLAEAERIGILIAEKALVATPRPLAGDQPATARQLTVDLRLESLDDHVPADLAAEWRSEAQVSDAGRAALLDAWIQWAEQRREDEACAWQAPVTAFRWGPLTLVGLPGEPFLTTADEIAAGVGGITMVTGYTNGCPGYLPAKDEYKFGGYEVLDAHRYYGMPAPFAAGSAEQLVQAAVDLVPK